MPKKKSTFDKIPERWFSREKKSGKIWKKWKFWLILVGIIFVILLFIFRVIVIELTFMEENTHALFSIITAFIWGMYLHVLGFSFGITQTKWRILIVIVLLIFYVWFSAYLGIRIILNIPIFIYNRFCTNTAEAAYFFGFNLPLWTVLWLVSLFTEKED
jgi:hypothetical protein